MRENSYIVILVSILVLKLNATIGLLFGSLVMGLGCGMGLVNTVSTICTGFGSLMAGIGLPIGLGVILGQLLADCGSARVIAKTLVKKKTSSKCALYALAFQGDAFNFCGFVKSILMIFTVFGKKISAPCLWSRYFQILT